MVTTTRHNRTAWIGNLIVTPEHRRQGVGSALLQRLVHETRRRGFPFVYLFTQQEAAFFARRGGTALMREQYRGAMVTAMGLALVSDNLCARIGRSLSSNIEEVNRERLERTPKLV